VRQINDADDCRNDARKKNKKKFDFITVELPTQKKSTARES